MTSPDLVAFLKARLDEDEARVVRDAAGHVGDRTARELHEFRHDIKSGTLGDLMLDPARPDDRTVPWMVARQLEDIADGFWSDWMDRALREVEAKRRILINYESYAGKLKDHPHDLALSGALLALLGALRDLARVWSDHPDYDQAWA